MIILKIDCSVLSFNIFRFELLFSYRTNNLHPGVCFSKPPGFNLKLLTVFSLFSIVILYYPSNVCLIKLAQIEFNLKRIENVPLIHCYPVRNSPAAISTQKI